MTATRLPADTSIGGVRLRVRDLDASAEFYGRLLGLVPATAGPSGVAWSNEAGGPAFIHLEADPATQHRPEGVFGIYHYAVLYPDRASLARTLRRLFAARWPFTGFSDHGVSEAAYLDDPDGIGVELYVDRPRDRWPWHGDVLAMYTRPLDLEDLLRAAEQPGAATPGGDARIGHVHLHVRDIGRSDAFYTDALGLDSMAELPGARFLSAGGYHHHLGLNSWARREAPAGAAGLLEWMIDVDAAGYAETVDRLQRGGVPIEAGAAACRFDDPDGNTIVLRQPG